MSYLSVDWPNITATLIASVIGGMIAARVAKQQINAAIQVERDKSRREISLELLDAIDSYIHIAYRNCNNEEEARFERQRLRRRLLSLTALTMPEQFSLVQSHLDQVDLWWRKQRTKGVGYTNTEIFFDELKEKIFTEIFHTPIVLSVSSEAQSGGSSETKF